MQKRELSARITQFLENAETQIGKHNTELLGEYLEKCAALPTEPTESRLLTIGTRMKGVSRMLDNRPLDQLAEKDLQTLNLRMREREMKSARDYRKVLKKFFTLKDKKKYIDLIDSPYMKSPRRKNGSRKLVDPDEFWNEEECNRYLEESKLHSTKHACWAGLWLSTAARPLELLQLRKKDIVFEEPAIFILRIREGKTGKRSVILEGAEAKGVWHYVRPRFEELKDNEEVFGCTYNAMLKVHRRTCKKAHIGSDKRINFYIARKMGLTRFYNTFGLVKAASMAGHVPGSGAMKHYLALNEAQLREKKPINVELKTCPNPSCASTNEPHKTSCEKCGSPLDRQKFAKIMQKNVDELIDVKLILFKKELEVKLLDDKKNRKAKR